MFKKILYIFFIVVLNSCSKKEKLYFGETQSIIDNMFDDYFEAFSNKEFEKILDKYYDIPFIIYDQNNTIILNSRNELLSFLENASNQLDKSNYGYSKTNFFEEFREDNNLIILEMNYTRYKKDGSVMGNKEMKATYVLRKSDKNYKVISLTPHSSIINN
jgi:ketosteroid isomerase-like protein